MTLRWLYTALWNALYVLSKENPTNEELGLWVDDGYPYVWEGRYSKHEYVLKNFEQYVCSTGMLKDNYDRVSGYQLVHSYVHNKTEWGGLFDDISAEEWSKLFDLIQEDERGYLPFHVDSEERWANAALPPASMKGKTITSIEYVRDGEDSKARKALQINLGRFSVRLECWREGEPWADGPRVFTSLIMREHALTEPFKPEEGTPHAYMVDEVVTGVALILYACCCDTYEGILFVHMGFVLRTKYAVHCFYRRGMTSDLIYVADHVPSDEELGMDEVAAFWSAGTTGFGIVRDDWEL